MHSFHKSLISGKIGEAIIAKAFPKLIALNGKEADFKHEDTGELYELKTDNYAMHKTPNFFIELYSDVMKQKVGGPAQAVTHGSKYWLYFYIKDKVLFTFELEPLVAWISDNSLKYKIIEIPNRGYTTVGITVPREHLKQFYKEQTLEYVE